MIWCEAFTPTTTAIATPNTMPVTTKRRQSSSVLSRSLLLSASSNKDHDSSGIIGSGSTSTNLRTADDDDEKDDGNDENNLNVNNPDDNEGKDEEDSTVVTVTHPVTGQCVTLIGTAHLSERSNQQVERLMAQLQPDAVMIELDPSRLERLGYDDGIAPGSTLSTMFPTITTSEQIPLPPTLVSATNPDGFVGLIQQGVAFGLSRVARLFLTQMYKSIEQDLNQKAGGEFAQAIASGDACSQCQTLILGDRNSIETLQRVVELAFLSPDGGVWGVWDRLNTANQHEMEQLEISVRQELQAAAEAESRNTNTTSTTATAVADEGGIELDQTIVTKAIIEKLKDDEHFRTQLFAKLEQTVPEFTQAFLKERDYLMSAAIVRELQLPPSPKEGKEEEDTTILTTTTSAIQTVVGVVGLAHVPGMERCLKSSFNIHEQ